MPRMTMKLFMALLYLGLLFLFIGVFFIRAQSFEGVVVIEQGRAERWAVQPAGSAGFFATAHRNMPVEVIGFDNPRAALRVLGATTSFDAAPLPYRLHLSDVEVLERPPDQHVLEVHCPEQRRVVEAVPDTRVDIPEGRLVIGERAPWTGLLRDGRGAPMAAITARLGDAAWTPPLFIRGNGATRPLPGLAVALAFVDAEESARADLPEDMPEMPTARWGVVEEERVHWFDSLTPGTGLTTAAGTEYVLLATTDANPPQAITVGRRDAAEAVRIEIAANNESPDGDIRFEAWRDEVIVLLRAWRDGAALLRYYHPEKETSGPIVTLAEGDTVTIPLKEGGMRLRLEQLMRSAVAVTDQESDVTALVVDTPNGPRRLREGESLQLDETRLRYRRQPQAPVVSYGLRAVFDADAEAVAFTLSPGKSRRIGGWRFSNDQPHGEADAYALLSARRVAGTPSRYIGAILFILGVVGVCVLRFADWRRVAPASENIPWTEIDRIEATSPSSPEPDNSD